MEIQLRENIVFNALNSEKELKEIMVTFIMNSRANKVLFTGNPRNVDYKLMKRIVPNSVPETISGANNIHAYINVSEFHNARNIYESFIENLDCKYCIIYKK